MTGTKTSLLIWIGLWCCWPCSPTDAQIPSERHEEGVEERGLLDRRQDEQRPQDGFDDRLNVRLENDERERLETERHDFTQSTTLVGRGVTQLEFGYTYFQENGEEGRVDSHTTPELLVRYGIAENLEFRLRYNQVWQYADEDREGSEDLRWSLKWQSTQQSQWRPESAIELRLSTPTGAADWSTDDVEFGVDVIYGWRLSRRMQLSASTGFATNALGEFSFVPEDPELEDFMLYTQSVALGMEMSRRSTIYYEFFGLFTDGFESDDRAPVFFNIGIDRYITDDLLVDVRFGTGLNADAEDFFVGLGGAVRF